MAAGRLAVKSKAEEFEAAGDFAITESSEAAQSSPHDNHEIAVLMAGCEGWGAVALAASLDELASNVTSDFESFGDRPSLGDEARKLFGGCEIDAFRKQFHVNLKGEFHPETRVA